MDERRLQSIPLFADLSKSELREVARLADEVDVSEGTRLIEEGTLAYEFFAIEEGTAEVTREDEVIAELEAGDIVGEMGVMARGRRNATVTARSPMTLVVMNGRDLRHIDREMPQVRDRLEAAINERCAGTLA
jgi:CRP-like cAMP-binding protein